MTHKRRPEHPFPGLACGRPSQSSPSLAFTRSVIAGDFSPLSATTGEVRLSFPPTQTPAHRRFCDLIRKGARVLLDLESGQCLLYTCANGLKMIARLTIRTLSQLLRSGDLVLAARENHWIHYAHPGANLAWFQPEP